MKKLIVEITDDGMKTEIHNLTTIEIIGIAESLRVDAIFRQRNHNTDHKDTHSVGWFVKNADVSVRLKNALYNNFDLNMLIREIDISHLSKCRNVGRKCITEFSEWLKSNPL